MNKKRKFHKRRRIAAVLCCAGLVCLALVFILRGQKVLPTEQSGAESTLPQTQPLRMMLSDARTLLSAGTEDGYYEISNPLFLLDAQNLVYIDYQTSSKIFLCSTPNCSHDSAECPCYLTDTVGGVDVFTAYDRLFVIYYGAINSSDKNCRPRIEVRHLDGSDPHIVCQLASGEAFYHSVAVDDKYVYYVKQAAVWTDGNTELHGETVLERTDIASGQTVTLRQMAPSEFFVGVDGQNLVLKTFIDREDNENEAFVHRIFAIDIEGKDTTDFHPLEWTHGDFLEYVANDGKMYYVTDKPCQVKVYDLHTGETRILVEHLPTEYYYSVRYETYKDGILVIRTSDEDAVRRDYAIDTIHGGYSEISLPFVSALGVQMSTPVLAFNSGSVLVQTGSTERSYHIEAEKSQGPEVVTHPVYAILPWTDYLASTPHYTPVTDLTLPAA